MSAIAGDIIPTEASQDIYYLALPAAFCQLAIFCWSKSSMTSDRLPQQITHRQPG